MLMLFKIKDEYCVFMNCCVDNSFRKPRTSKGCLFKSKNERKVIKYAKDYCKEEIVEYGIDFCY